MAKKTPEAVLHEIDPFPSHTPIQSFGMALVNPSSKHLPIVLMHCKSASRFAKEYDDDGNVVYVAEFMLTRVELTAFRKAYEISRSWKTSFFFFNRSLDTITNHLRWIDCFVNSFDSDDLDVYCRSFSDSYAGTYLLPCALAKEIGWIHDDYTADPARLYKAACIRKNYHRCPNIDFSRFKVIKSREQALRDAKEDAYDFFKRNDRQQLDMQAARNTLRMLPSKEDVNRCEEEQ